jgi:hypothetical protein
VAPNGTGVPGQMLGWSFAMSSRFAFT